MVREDERGSRKEKQDDGLIIYSSCDERAGCAGNGNMFISMVHGDRQHCHYIMGMCMHQVSWM